MPNLRTTFAELSREESKKKNHVYGKQIKKWTLCVAPKFYISNWTARVVWHKFTSQYEESVGNLYFVG